MSSILVLGGAGYIGSHTVYELIETGEKVVVVDNLETGFRKAVHPDAKFYQGDIRDRAFIDSVFEKEDIDGVIHFAANSQVGESMVNPLKYYNNNLCGTEVLLESMVAHGINKIVFSSTAATYGEPERIPILETDRTVPTNCYGETKFSMERCLNGQRMPMIYVLYPCAILMPVEHIQMERLGKPQSGDTLNSTDLTGAEWKKRVYFYLWK